MLVNCSNLYLMLTREKNRKSSIRRREGNNSMKIVLAVLIVGLTVLTGPSDCAELNDKENLTHLSCF